MYGLTSKLLAVQLSKLCVLTKDSAYSGKARSRFSALSDAVIR